MALGKNISRKKDSLFPEKGGKVVKPKSKAILKKVATKKVSNKKDSYNISGEVTISNIKKIFDEIKDKLNGATELEVNVRDIGTYDLSFLQLLHSLKQEKRIRLEIVGLEKEKLEQLGFYNIL